MAFSQNGGVVLDYGDSHLVSTVVPGTTAAKFPAGINGADLNTVLMYAAARWHNEVEPVIAYGCWGFNVRAIRGQTTGYSNHSAGEAIDINAPQHPLGTLTLTAKQKDALHSICNAVDNVIRAGAFYTGRKDEMHLERDKSYAEVTRVANLIRSGALPNTPDELLSRVAPTKPTKPTKPSTTPAPTPAPTPTPAPAPPIEEDPLAGIGIGDIEDSFKRILAEKRIDHTVMDRGDFAGVYVQDVLNLILTKLDAVADAVVIFTVKDASGKTLGIGEANVVEKTWSGFSDSESMTERQADLVKAGLRVVILSEPVDPAERGWTQLS